MHYYNLFFLKKCYLNYDRETVLNTCIMIAAKTQNIHELNQKYLVTNQINMARQLTQGKRISRTSSLDMENEREAIATSIFKHESLILEVCNFNFEITTVHAYVDRFFLLMYNSHY